MTTWLDTRRIMELARAFDLRDALGLLSVAAILWGVAQWSRPLAWVIGGSLGLAFWMFPYVWRRKGA